MLKNVPQLQVEGPRSVRLIPEIARAALNSKIDKQMGGGGDESKSMWRTPCDMQQRIGPNNVGAVIHVGRVQTLAEGLRLRVELAI